MTSENKKRKQVNAYVIKTALKSKNWKCKRIMFYNSSNRRELNKLAKAEQKETLGDDMAEFINTKEQIIKVGDKISVTNDGSLPFLVKRNGSTTNVAFNKDGEYLVSVFDGNVTVTTLQSQRNGDH